MAATRTAVVVVGRQEAMSAQISDGTAVTASAANGKNITCVITNLQFTGLRPEDAEKMIRSALKRLSDVQA